MDKVIDFILSRKAHAAFFLFWLGPGIALSVLFRQSVLWVALMSAYANLMLHLIELHQARDKEKEENEKGTS